MPAAGELCSNTLTWKDLWHLNPISDKAEMPVRRVWAVLSHFLTKIAVQNRRQGEKPQKPDKHQDEHE